MNKTNSYQFLSRKRGFTSACGLKRRLWTSPTGEDWCSLLYYYMPNPDMDFVGYVPESYPGGYPPYTRAQYLASLSSMNPLPPLPMYLDEYQALMDEATKYLGQAYLWGGRTPPNFDCSGFVGWCLKETGLLDKSVISYTGTLWRACDRVTNPYYGDLVFWYGKGGTPDAVDAHVELFIGWEDETKGLYQTIGSAGGGVQYRLRSTQPYFYGFYRVPAR